jgi:hypothetical protein
VSFSSEDFFMREKIFCTPLLVIALLGLAACQTPVNEEQVGAKTDAGNSTVKPGAPVALEFATDGEPTLGAAIEVTLMVTSASPADGMQISLTADEGLAISPEQTAVQFSDVEPGVAQTHVINITPQLNGRLFINVFVTLDRASQQSVRTFAVPLQVGPEAVQEKAPQVKREDGERIISLPAEES